MSLRKERKKSIDYDFKEEEITERLEKYLFGVLKKYSIKEKDSVKLGKDIIKELEKYLKHKGELRMLSKRSQLENKVNKSMKKLSTYKMQKAGISSSTITRFRKNPDLIQIRTLEGLEKKLSQIK